MEKTVILKKQNIEDKEAGFEDHVTIDVKKAA